MFVACRSNWKLGFEAQPGMKLDVNLIAEATGLTLEEIEKLQVEQ
jgi:hypothetical protein